MSGSFLETETAVRLYDARLDQLHRILDEFPEEKIWQRPPPGMISLGNLICHVAGSMREWFENGLAQGNWQRDRQNEFDREGGMTRAELHAHLNETRDHCGPFLTAVSAATWNTSRPFRDKTFTVREIVLRQLDHVAYHAGQAAFLRRIVAGLGPTA